MTMNYKIALCGEQGVGKSSLAHRLIFNEFSEYKQPTIGASFLAWTLVRDRKYTFGLWDLAGSNRFNNLLPIYFRGLDAAVYCIDSTQVFNGAKAEQVCSKLFEISPRAVLYIAVTKCDRASDCKVPMSIIESFAIAMGGVQVFYTSAATGHNVAALFNTIAEKLISIEKPESVALGNDTWNQNSSHGSSRFKCAC